MAIYKAKNGNKYSEDTVMSAADKAGISLDEFVSNKGLEKIEEEEDSTDINSAKINDIEINDTQEDDTETIIEPPKKKKKPVTPSKTVSSNNPFYEKIKPYDPLGLNKLRNASATKPKKSVFDFSAANSTIDYANSKLLQDLGGPKAPELRSPMVAKMDAEALKKQQAEKQTLEKQQTYLDETKEYRQDLALERLSFENPDNVNYDIDKKSATASAINLNKKINRLGLEAEEFGDEVIFRKIGEEEGFGGTKNGTHFALSDIKGMNQFVSNFGDKSYAKKVKEISAKKYPDLFQKITPPVLSEEEKRKQANLELIGTFQNLSKAYGFDEALGGRAAKITKESFDNPEDYNFYKQWAKDQNSALNLPQSRIDAWDKSRKEKFITKASTDYARSLDPSDRKNLQIVVQEKINESRYASEKLNQDIGDYKLKVNDFNKDAEEYKKAPTPEKLDILKSRELGLIDELNDITDREKDLQKETDYTKGILAPALTSFSANYNRINQLTNAATSTLSSVAVALRDISAYGSAPLIGKTQEEIIKDDSLGIFHTARELELQKQQYQKTVGIDEIKSFDDAGNWLMSSTVNTLPSIGMAFTGAAALPLFFASGYGGKATQMMQEAEDAKKRLSENTYAINNTDDAFIKAQLQSQIDADKDLLNLPEYKKLLGKLVYGGAEVGFEMLGTLKILKGVGTAARMLPKKSLKDGLLWAGKNATKNFNREGLSELGTTVTDNFSDIYLLGANKNLFEGGLESYVQGGVAGAGFGGIDTYKVVKRAIASELASKKQNRRIQEIVNQISDLTGIKGYKKDQSIPLPMQTPAVQKLIAELVDESNGIETDITNRLGIDLTFEQVTQVGDINRQIREVNKDFSEAAEDPNLKPAQLKTLEGYYRNKFNELVNQRETLLTDLNILKASKEANIDARFEFDATQGYGMYNYRMQKISIGKVFGNFSNLNATTKNELLFNAKNELEAELEESKNPKVISKKDIENKAFKTYAQNHYTKAIKDGIASANAFAKSKGVDIEIIPIENKPDTIDDNGEVIKGKTVEEQMLEIVENSDVDKSDPKYKKTIAAIKKGQLEGTNTTIGGKPVALINIQLSAENGRTGIGSHEVLHSAVKKAFTDQDKINEAGKSLLTYLEQFNPDLSALVNQRIDSSYSERDENDLRLRDENGEIIKNEDYYEEALNALSDISADGVELPADSLNAIRNFINSILPKGFPKFKENQGADVYQFVKDYNKEAHFGEKQPSNLISFSGRMIGGDQEEKPTIKQSVTKVNEVQQKIDKLEDQYDNDEIEYEAYENKLGILKDELKKAKAMPEEIIKPKVEKPKAKVSQEDEVAEIIKNEKGTISSDKVQQIYESKGVNGADEIIKLFKPITKKIVDKRRDAPGFDRELLTDEIETGSGGILDLIRSYNASKGVPLAAYINKQLPLRAIASSKRLLDESFSKDVTEEKGLMAAETSTEVKEKPKYKNALESKVFSPEVLKTATNKIVTIVRTLKSRIDAPVTLNRTVTPLIAEIRDEVGKQLDIDIKTMLGGKKDGVLRKELLRTKRYILENMTTTWLMGKDGQGGIPQAIQKQINGKYVSYPDWVGQKIDREKTTTDQAGRTSGAELVRRLPNVANNISDEVFLSQIIGPDGNPIRGRKESLSKAMSEEGAFDIINNDFETGGPIFDAFKVNQERLGVEIAANAVVTFAAQSERGNIKQSVTYNNFTQEQKNIFNSKVSELSSGLNPYLNNIDNPDTVGRVFRNAFKNYFSKEEINGLLKDFAPWLRQIKDVSNSDTLYAEDKNLDLDTFIKNVASMYEAGVLGVLNMPYTHEELFSKNNVISARTATINMFSNWVNEFGKEKAIEMMIYSGGTFKSNSALGNKKGIAFVNGEIIETGKEGRKSNQITQNAEDYWNNIVYASLPDGASEENQKLLKRIQKETASKRKKDSASKAFADRDFEGREKESKKYQEIVQETFKYYFNDKNSVSDIDKAIMIVQMGSNMETAIRKAAVFTHVFVNPTGAKVGALRYEHTRPASQVAAELLAAYKKYKGNVPQEVLNSIWETYTAAVIPVAMDDQINAAGFKSIMPPGWTKAMPTSYRYYNYATFGKDNIFAIESLNPKDKGAIIGEEFVKASKIFIKPKINAIKIDAIQKSSKNSITPKGISVFDFDDTSAFTSGSVLYTMPDGSKGKLNAEEFAKEGSSFLEEGAIFDFSEFSKVVDGKPGPMVEKMKKMIAKFGNENFFILTARPANAAVPIKEFLDSIGIDIPLENITGLGNSAAQAKADWMTAKAAEGYNDFYFADDAIQNVEAVKKALDIPGVDSKVQQAMIKFSLTSKQDLKWRQSDEDLSTNFKVGNNSYRIALREIGSMEYDDDINTALLDIVENNNLDYDKTIGDIDGNAYDVEFSDKKRGTGITGTGNAAEVFGTVLNGVIELANKRNIKAFTFNAKEPSRIKLYNSMTNIIADRLGWDSKAENGTYLLYDKSLIRSTKEKPKAATTEIPNNSSWIDGNNGRFYEKNIKAGNSELRLLIKNADVKVDFDWDAELSDENFVQLIKENNLNPENFKYVFAPQNTKQFVFINSNKELENIPKNDISSISNAINEFVNGNNIKTITLSSDNISDGNKNIDNLFKTIATNVSKDLNFNLYSKEGSFILTEKEATIGSEKGIGSLSQVKDVLNVVDIKSPINQSKIKFSKTISSEFNKIIEENTGMENYKVFSDIVARRRGVNKNKFDFYVPPSAADFELLLYNFIGKGTRGEEQQKFFADALLKPYANGNDLMDAARQSIKNDYKALINQFPGIKKKIESLTPDGDFTYDQAIRVALWTEEGIEIPGLSQRDQTKLVDLINNDPELTAFKQGVLVTGRQGKGWVAPTEYWDASTIISDLHNLTEGAGRKKFLAEFIENTEEMFGKFENGKLVGPNMNKIEAVYGTNVREALEDSLYRMINGKNKSIGNDKETSRWSNWVNGSTGTIMFLNTRSAALQLLGAVNFLNFRDNNPFAAAKAFANQKQYWADFVRIWNSDKMKERRGGLKEDVAAAEIANAAAGSKNKANAVISYLLKIGYTPTQLADSFAIAMGGAPFYRNRIKSYLKEGRTQDEAEANAWSDFTKVSDETQQSGDPRDISKQQASPAGRLLLTFQNFSMQQSRIVKKSFLDLKNGRGDAKTHVAKIIYYLAVQNILFSVLQQGLFAVAFDDDDEELDKEKDKAKKKTLNERLVDVADGVLDTILRGTGFVGGVISVLKNMTKKYLDEKDKGFKADYAKVMLEGANISPPIGSKLRKVYTGLQQTKFEKDLIDERGWGVMQDGRVHLGPMYGVTGKLVEATTNIPMDRLVNKIENVSQAMNSQNKAWQRVAVALGFTPYSVGIEDTKGDLEIRAKAKATRKEEGKTKRKDSSQQERDSIANLSEDAYMDFVRKRKEARERKKDSIANLPADQKKAYLEKKAIESEARKREKEALKKIKSDSIAGLSPSEKANYNKKVAAEKLQKKKERHDKYEEKKKALQDSLAGLTPRQREKYKADKKAERHQYYIKNKKPSKKKNRIVSSDTFI